MAIYNKTTWANNITPLNQENMNHIEEGIFTVSSESYTTCVASYSSDTLQFIFKNAGDQQLGNTISLNVPTSSSLVSISYDDNTKSLSYTTRGGSSTNVLEVYNVQTINTMLGNKADKEGPLPYLSVTPTTNMAQFVTMQHNINSHISVILKDSGSGRTFLAAFYYIPSLPTMSFEIKEVGTENRWQGTSVSTSTFANMTFSDCVSDTYKNNFELAKNKVTSISSSSTDKQYASAKCTYDALTTQYTTLSGLIEASGHFVAMTFNIENNNLSLSLKDENNNILGNEQIVNLPFYNYYTKQFIDDCFEEVDLLED